MEDQVKRCSKCKQIKNVSEFRLKTKGLSAYRSSCRKCEAAYARSHAKAHPDKVRASYNKLLGSHKEQERERSRRYNEEHREEINAKIPCSPLCQPRGEHKENAGSLLPRPGSGD